MALTKFGKRFSRLTPEQKKDFAEKSGVKIGYLYHLASGYRQASYKMWKRLQKADASLTYEMLRPDLFK
jgi:predicted transcriptional regulator